MVRLVLDLLGRQALGGPVPFLAPVASWDPSRQDLRSWLAARLVIDQASAFSGLWGPLKERDKGPSRGHWQLHSVRHHVSSPCTATRWSELRHTTSLSASAAPRRHFGLPARSAAACTVTLMLILGLDGGGTSTKAVLADVQTEAVTVVGMGIAVGGSGSRAWPGMGNG